LIEQTLNCTDMRFRSVLGTQPDTGLQCRSSDLPLNGSSAICHSPNVFILICLFLWQCFPSSRQRMVGLLLALDRVTKFETQWRTKLRVALKKINIKLTA